MQLGVTSESYSFTYQPYMFRHCIMTFLGALAGILVHYYLITSNGYEVRSLRLIGFLASTGLWIAITYSMYYVSIGIGQFIDNSDLIGTRLLLGLIANGIIAFLLVCLFYRFSEPLSVHFADNLTWIGDSISKIGIVTTITAVIFSVILFAFLTFESYTKEQVNYIDYQRRQIDLRVMALKSQLSPHFLFNGLNTISSLIYTDKDKAETYIRNLFSTYNYALSQYNNATVTLKDELQLVHAYINMIKIRYGNCIQFYNNIGKDQYGRQVLPFSLQTLIENALKHNIAKDEAPLQIKLDLQNNNIVVSNNKQLRELHHASTGVGHKNLKERYKLLGSKEIRIKESNTYYSVQIPLLD